MTANQEWERLLELVEQSVPKGEGRGRPQLKWGPPNRLVLLDRCDVQARFSAQSAKYSIYFEGFGTNFGPQSVDEPPEPEVWTIEAEQRNEETFWRLPDGQVQKSPDLAKEVVARLQIFHDACRKSEIATD
jgi:hypothetical protein